MQIMAHIWNVNSGVYMENKISEILNAISHPNRIRILKELQKEGMLCGCEMLPRLGLEQSNLSRHLSTLVKAGVLISWKDGVRMNYKIADERIFDLIDLAENISTERLSVRKSVVA
jgi:DNA-binding transcriptional ArsR family regulator